MLVIGDVLGISRSDTNIPPFIEYLLGDLDQMQKIIDLHKNLGKKPAAAPLYILGN